MTKAPQTELDQLRMVSIQRSIESISMFVLALFISAILPSLLFRYLYADAALTEQPKILEYIPVAAFVLGVGFFAFAMVGNIMREKKIKMLLKEVADMGCDCGCVGGCACCDDSMDSKPKKSGKKS